MKGKGFLPTIILLTVFLSLEIPEGLVSAPNDRQRGGSDSKEWIEGYSSLEISSGMNTGGGPKKHLYNSRNLENLRQAIPPRYVRVLDWKNYGVTGKSINKGILFTYSGYRNRRVFLAGNFNNWQPMPLIRNRLGIYYIILPVREIEEGVRYNSPDFVYRYKFLVDEIWTHDPVNKHRVDDGLGSYVSEFRLRNEEVNRQITVRILKEKVRGPERLVEFAIHLPDVKNLALVGNFNNWNTEHDLMSKGEDGIFRLRLRLKPGDYVYKYIADGRWLLDHYNPQTRYFKEIDELCSYIRIR